MLAGLCFVSKERTPVSLSARMLLAEDNGMNMEIAEFLSENAGISGEGAVMHE